MLTNEQWQPVVRFNLLNGSNFQFRDAIDTFERYKLEHGLPTFSLTTGWHSFTAQAAEAALMRNRKNRTVHLPTVLAYASQMVNGDWKKTGQPIIFTDDEFLLDGQHRLWACYLTGRPFESYVLTGVKQETLLFAYIDNIRPRTGADALHTAGKNSLSRHLSSVIEFAHRWDTGVLTLTGRSSVMPLSPREEIAYSDDHPDLMEAAHYIDTNFKTAKTRLGPKMATFLGWKIIAKHGTEIADSFFDAITRPDLPDNHPIAALRRHVEPPFLSKKEKERRLSAKAVPEVQVLAYAIVAFNMMMKGDKLSAKDKGKLPLNLGDAFPELSEPTPPVEDAAE